MNELQLFINFFKRNLVDTNYHKYFAIIFFLNFIVRFFFEVQYKLFVNPIIFVIYWYILGVLSTIGFGFGFHTGVMFLFPKIVSEYGGNGYEVFMNNLVPMIFWSIGSSFGELPPYLIMYSGKDSIENYLGKSNWIMNKVNNFLLKINNKNSRRVFITIMAAWPNMTFDMCGILCGYMKIPLLEFLVPTVIGKTLIKTPIQVLALLWVTDKGVEYEISNSYVKYVFIVIVFSVSLYSMIKYIINNERKYLENKKEETKE